MPQTSTVQPRDRCSPSKLLCAPCCCVPDERDNSSDAGCNSPDSDRVSGRSFIMNIAHTAPISDNTQRMPHSLVALCMPRRGVGRRSIAFFTLLAAVAFFSGRSAIAQIQSQTTGAVHVDTVPDHALISFDPDSAL